MRKRVGYSKWLACLTLAGILATASYGGEAVLLAQGNVAIQSAQVKGKALDTLNQLYKFHPDWKGMQRNVMQSEDGATYTIIFIKQNQPTGRVVIEAQTGVIEWLIREDLSQGKATPAFVKQKAEAFLKATIGEEFKQYRVEQQNDSSVVYQRYINGIRVMNDSYSVQVNDKGSIIDVTSGSETRRGVSAAQWLKPSSAIKKAAAEKQMAQSLALMYLRSKNGDIKLTYVPGFGNFLDARTGKHVNPRKEGVPNAQLSKISFTPGHKQVTAKDTIEMALVMQNEFGVNLSGKSFGESTMPKEMLGDEEKEYVAGDYTSGQVVVKMRGQQVVGFHVQESVAAGAKKQKSILSAAQALGKAKAFLEPYLDEAHAEMFYQIVENKHAASDKPQVKVMFYPTLDGVPFKDESSYVEVDMVTGSIVGYHHPGKELPIAYPNQNQAKSAAEATKAIMAKAPLELVYLYTNTQPNPVLAYTFKDFDSKVGHVDAITGHAQ